MTASNAVRLAVVTFVTLVIQSTVVLDIRVAGAHPDVMVLLPIAAGLVGGPNAGAWVGFGAGLVADLFVPAPFGLTALTYTLVGFGVGATLALATRSLAGLDRNSWWLAGLVALAASVIAVMLYAVLGALIGQEQMLKLDLGAIAAVVAVPNALLAVPAVRAMSWALGTRRGSAEHRALGTRS